MTKRVWLASMVASALIACSVAVAVMLGRNIPALTSKHSQPPVSLPAGPVAVTAAGKTFHRPGCRYIHGPPKLVSAAEAVREGYSPCVRCMHEALSQ